MIITRAKVIIFFKSDKIFEFFCNYLRPPPCEPALCVLLLRAPMLLLLRVDVPIPELEAPPILVLDAPVMLGLLPVSRVLLL